nr:NPC intracellular cholesterol transporter 2-like isoform X2 [Procambarus clarkii]
MTPTFGALHKYMQETRERKTTYKVSNDIDLWFRMQGRPKPCPAQWAKLKKNHSSSGGGKEWTTAVLSYNLITMALLAYISLLCAFMFTVTWATTYNVPFRSCGDVPAPSEMRINCSSLDRGSCMLNKGETYIIHANFTPRISSNDVESKVSWHFWVDMPLPNQESDACNGHLKCPLRKDVSTTFTYLLKVQNFWMRRRYPIVWRLMDDDTDAQILCFRFSIHIL